MKDTLELECELLTTRALLARQEANVTALLARIDELETSIIRAWKLMQKSARSMKPR